MGQKEFCFEKESNYCGGVGVSVPIVIIGDLGDFDGVDSSVKAGFNVNLLVGVGYAVTEKVMPLIEWSIGFGTGWSWQLRAGLTYKFGGGAERRR